MKLTHFPDDVIDHHQLKDKADARGFVYVKCIKGMYGLPHAGIIAQQLFEELLNFHDYYQSTTTPVYQRHKWRPISFLLILDHFVVKYVGKEHVHHLLKFIRENYTVSRYCYGSKYSGISLDWYYDSNTVHVLLV